MSEVSTATKPTAKFASTRLGEATVQEMQLELIRRRNHHGLDGQQVADCLLEHRDLWEAVMLDRLTISHPGSLPTMGLMKLRDFPKNQWNADRMYVLTASRKNAERLAEIFAQQRWGGMVDVHADPEEVDNALGGAEPGQAVVAVWWD